LRVFDVEELPTHGASLRIYGCHQQDSRLDTEAIPTLLEAEKSFGMRNIALYQSFQECADTIKNGFLRFLLNIKAAGSTVVAYGAAAKGNTLLNYAGVRPDLLPCVVDRNPAKQGKFLPGSRIPIVGEDYLINHRPDTVLILPWNIKEEIINQLAYIRQWGGRFATAVPRLEVI
jgi:hypothetical protein